MSLNLKSKTLEHDLELERLDIMTDTIHLGQSNNYDFWAGIPRAICGRAGANYLYSHAGESKRGQAWKCKTLLLTAETFWNEMFDFKII